MLILSPTTSEPSGIRTTNITKKTNIVTPYLTQELILENTSNELDLTFIKKQSVSTPTRYIPIKAMIKTLRRSKS